MKKNPNGKKSIGSLFTSNDAQLPNTIFNTSSTHTHGNLKWISIVLCRSMLILPIDGVDDVVDDLY